MIFLFFFYLMFVVLYAAFLAFWTFTAVFCYLMLRALAFLFAVTVVLGWKAAKWIWRGWHEPAIDPASQAAYSSRR